LNNINSRTSYYNNKGAKLCFRLFYLNKHADALHIKNELFFELDRNMFIENKLRDFFRKKYLLNACIEKNSLL